MSVGIQAAVRECGICGEVKPLVAFTTYKGRHGEACRLGICKKCREDRASVKSDELRAWRKKYSKEYNEKNRSRKATNDAARRAEAKAFVDEYKSSRPCLDCGRKFPPVAMDLDHVRGAKIRNVSGLVSGAYRLELIKAEIEKCDVVCACCHRIRTASRGENRYPPTKTRSVETVRVSLSNKKMITINGETYTISEWERKLGITRGIASYRMRHGYSVEEAFTSKLYNTGLSPVRARLESSLTQKQIEDRSKARSEIAIARWARMKSIDNDSETV